MEKELLSDQSHEELTENLQLFKHISNNEKSEITENKHYVREKIKVPVHELNDMDVTFGKNTENTAQNIEVNNLSSALENQRINDDKMMKINLNSQVLQNQAEVLSENDDSIINNEHEIITDENKINSSDDKSQDFIKLVYDWTSPKLLCTDRMEFKRTDKCENFTKGCHWSPDGTCILVPADDFKFRIFDLPQELYSGKIPQDFCTPSIESSVRIKEGGTIYDTCWFPFMNSWDPSTCCFLSTSQDSPIHLWDAFTGQLRATYRAYNQVDEVEAAISVQFTDLGGQIWSGFKNALRTFDTSRPGRQISTISFKNDFPNITGLVSCIRENPGMNGLIAFGTYSKYIGLFKDGPLCSFKTGSGVTQIEFSPCGTKLYSSIRRGSEFLCWDLRNPGTVLYSLQTRQSDTNQRIYFSLSYNGEEIVSGGTDGAVRVWKIPQNLQIEADLNPYCKIQMTQDCINGVNLHKNLPILAVSTGTRICEQEENNTYDSSLKLYWLQKQQ